MIYSIDLHLRKSRHQVDSWRIISPADFKETGKNKTFCSLRKRSLPITREVDIRTSLITLKPRRTKDIYFPAVLVSVVSALLLLFNIPDRWSNSKVKNAPRPICPNKTATVPTPPKLAAAVSIMDNR